MLLNVALLNNLAVTPKTILTNEQTGFIVIAQSASNLPPSNQRRNCSNNLHFDCRNGKGWKTGGKKGVRWNY